MHITTLLNSGHVNISCELFPPKEFTGLNQATQVVKEIAALKPSFMSVTYGAGGNTQAHTLEVSKAIQKANITPLFHLTCVNSDVQKVQNTLETLKANGIENILALRGDMQKDSVPSDDFRYASDLIRTIRLSGDFCIGAACYPEGHPESRSKNGDLAALKLKVDEGAGFLTSQMFFDNNIFYNFLYRALQKGINVPILAGIMPVCNAKQIKRITLLSGAALPPRFAAIVDRFQDDPAAMQQAGIAYASEQIIDLIANGVNNIHLYTMNRPAIAEAIFKNLSNIIGSSTPCASTL
jgi:5,10-methylenetetrahydrofolate reductase